MNDNVFRDMAEQMKPSTELVSSLFERIDQVDQATSLQPPKPAEPAVKGWRFSPWPVKAAALFGMAACLALVVGVGVRVGARPPVKPDAGSPVVSTLSPERGTPSQVDPPPVPAKAYSEVYKAIKAVVRDQMGNKSMWYEGRAGAVIPAGAIAEMSSSAVGDTMGAEVGGGFSTTNTQVAGIDEGDIVKTDGRYLYVASGARVEILLPDGAATSKVASLDLTPSGATLPGVVLDMMLSGDTLVVFVQEYQADVSAIGGSEGTAYVPYSVSQTKAMLYNVADPAKPELMTSMGQSGAYVTSRLTDNVLYLVSDYSLDNLGKIDQTIPATFVPKTWIDDKSSPVAPGEISIVEPIAASRYTVASAIDLNSATRLSTQTVLMGADTVYMGPDNLYIAAYTWESKVSEAQLGAAGLKRSSAGDGMTTILRLSLNGGKLAVAAQDVIPGTLLNQFSLDESGGFLRVAVDVSGVLKDGSDEWSRRAALYVLDSKLSIVGSIPKLVENESIKAVRFDGPVGYVVTFMQVDPLFAVDLSEPTKPVVMSKLKIPGFSSYLHPWADGRLLGLGVEADQNGTQSGLKLTMFNTTDPYAVTELVSEPVKGDYSEALYEHKAVLVDAKRGLIGFPTEAYGSENSTRSYVLYSYQSGSGFKELMKLPVAENPAIGQDSMAPCAGDFMRCGSFGAMGSGTRGVLINDFLYVTTEWQVDVYHLDSLKKAASVTLG